MRGTMALVVVCWFNTSMKPLAASTAFWKANPREDCWFTLRTATTWKTHGAIRNRVKSEVR
jgi:hypothetical protein